MVESRQANELSIMSLYYVQAGRMIYEKLILCSIQAMLWYCKNLVDKRIADCYFTNAAGDDDFSW